MCSIDILGNILIFGGSFFGNEVHIAYKQRNKEVVEKEGMNKKVI